MPQIETNRDLYIAITDLTDRQKESSRSLEKYLSAMWRLGSEIQKESQLSVNSFFGILAAAFVSVVPEFDEAWRERFAQHGEDVVGFDAWENTILRQIVNLCEMKEQGTLENELRYFGVSSPRGGYWYNFDPCSFLECATAGSCGGWQPGDNTGRDYVPGDVAVINEDGEVESRDPRDVDDPVFTMLPLTWDDFQVFLCYGQYYE